VYKPAADAVGGLRNLPLASVKINLSKYADADKVVKIDCEFAVLKDELIDELTFASDVLTEPLKEYIEPLTEPLKVVILPLTEELNDVILPLTDPLNDIIEPLNDELTFVIVVNAEELFAFTVPLIEDDTAESAANDCDVDALTNKNVLLTLIPPVNVPLPVTKTGT